MTVDPERGDIAQSDPRAHIFALPARLRTLRHFADALSREGDGLFLFYFFYFFYRSHRYRVCGGPRSFGGRRRKVLALDRTSPEIQLRKSTGKAGEKDFQILLNIPLANVNIPVPPFRPSRSHSARPLAKCEGSSFRRADVTWCARDTIQHNSSLETAKSGQRSSVPARACIYANACARNFTGERHN